MYNIFIFLYAAFIRVAALWNDKAKAWINGRKNVIENLQGKIHHQQPIIWVHAASAGEFEQAKPVIAALKKNYPHYQLLVSFFSPSGYQTAKNFSAADYITYLPLDTKQNATAFLDAIQPSLVIFTKYDFWYHHLKAIADRHIPLLLISSVFRPNQLFFKWYGDFYKKMLFFFSHIFVQDKTSLQLLHQNNIHKSGISGDTRFDRVAAIATQFTELPLIGLFAQENNIIVAGSTWPDDEQLLSAYINATNDCKLIIAPHEINKEHIAQICHQFNHTVLYSEAAKMYNEVEGLNNESFSNIQDYLQQYKVLVIDNVGMLSRLYHYAAICYVGGGFTKDGVHNILEAAVYGKPVIYGPNYQKYREAVELLAAGGAFTIRDAKEMNQCFHSLFHDPQQLQTVGLAAAQYVQNNKGATKTIIQYIQENRLLTN